MGLPPHLSQAASDYATRGGGDDCGGCGRVSPDSESSFTGRCFSDWTAVEYATSCGPTSPASGAGFLALDEEKDGDADAAIMESFVKAAQQLSPSELREFVEDHVSGELAAIRRLPVEQRAQAFRSLCAEWHPDKCPAISALATEIFQTLQAKKMAVLGIG